ncbi:MAG TPA: carboxypeptidase regulatory-like domain-containing protein [Terriglobales bacterium]|nr:carboxypeptidase regulatory-like domain-containing protein [Terriglobales bacterium]
MLLKRTYLILAILLALAVAAQAGSVSGSVSGAGKDSVVWVDNPSGKTEAPSKPFIIDQKGLVFVPHVLVVPVGSTVEFLNSDSVQHNVFWVSISGNKKLGKNLGTWPKGEKRSFKFENPGVVPLLCNVHPEMSAYVIAVPTSYYATTNASGEYAIENVPDGPHTITVWHEGMKQQSKQVTVSGASKADLTVSK